MKQINFKIEKNATESKTYIEFNSLIEFLRDTSNYHYEQYKLWLDVSREDEGVVKFQETELERSCEVDKLEYEITEQFIKFTKKVNENGFN